MKTRLALLAAFTLALVAQANEKPNIVYVIADDLGYGDVQCLAPETSKIPTPHADQLAKEGMIFTDAHSGASLCTPTRYGVLTGRYSWRTTLQMGVLPGFQPCLIAEDRDTVASLLKAHGYATAIIGKWHLCFNYTDPQSGEILTKPESKTKCAPVGAKILDGPIHRGFDYYHGFHHAVHMKAVIENDEVIARDSPINMLPRLTRKSVEYIDSRAGKETPFFLYVPLNAPHTPLLPTKEWQGKSGLGDYGDYVMQTDHALGEICKALERNGFADNTLIIFTSDNGCSTKIQTKALLAQGHHPSAHLRGFKSDIWDGGHRVPFIVRWPGKVEPNTTSDQLICHTDLMATLANLLDLEMPANAGEDSVSFLPALSGDPIVSTRKGVIHHSRLGHFAYRQGPWKLILARASGGWSEPTESQVPSGSPPGQLYHLGDDPGEQTNLFETKPEKVAELLALLTQDIQSGRSTDGAESHNDVDNINLWKSGTEVKK